MDKIARGSRIQDLHRKSDRYRAAMRRKPAAYHRHIQVGPHQSGHPPDGALTTSRTSPDPARIVSGEVLQRYPALRARHRRGDA